MNLKYTNLASEALGAKVIYTNDDFFAPKENLIKPGRGIFIEGKYTPNGKWMDGWESRRKRGPGHDYCIVKLGAPGKIHELDIDTNHFTGNYPPFASLDGILSKTVPTAKSKWVEVLPKSPLQGGSQNIFQVNNENIFNYIRLNIYPDGGVARLKVYGEVFKDWSKVSSKTLIDLAALVNGAKALNCSDMYFSHMENLILPGRAKNMGEGWETKRRRGPGYDWIILELGHRGKIHKIEVDTNHYKGNYPDTCDIEFCDTTGSPSQATWETLLPKTKLKAHFRHYFTVKNPKPCTHVRLNIYPDGGISRLRLMGYKV